jgi:tRNA (guanine26-N2/guanine27-N2)-dimethyltransferase
VPLYVSLHSMSATLKCTPPSATLFRSAVVNAGYCISGLHANLLGLKRDAPMAVLWDIMRCWVCTINLSSKCVAESVERADYVGLLV